MGSTYRTSACAPPPEHCSEAALPRTAGRPGETAQRITRTEDKISVPLPLLLFLLRYTSHPASALVHLCGLGSTGEAPLAISGGDYEEESVKTVPQCGC